MMPPAKTTTTMPIVSIREQGEVWQHVVLYSDKTGLCEDFPSKETAEKAARAWSEKTQCPFVPHDGSFISVYRVTELGRLKTKEPVYVACERPLNGKGRLRGTAYLEYDRAFAEALQIATREGKPFAPYYHTQDKERTIIDLFICEPWPEK